MAVSVCRFELALIRIPSARLLQSLKAYPSRGLFRHFRWKDSNSGRVIQGHRTNVAVGGKAQALARLTN